MILIKLVSIANTDGFYYKPRIDHDLLARHTKELISRMRWITSSIRSIVLKSPSTMWARAEALFSRN